MVNFKSFDLFALPFQFSMLGNDKQKRTIFGGLISFMIICLSLTYFFYLCYLYFGNKMQPSISITNEYLEQPFQINFDKNLIAFQIILSNGMSIDEFEKKQGKTYLSSAYSITTQDKDNNEVVNQLGIIQCEDPDLEGFLCLDFSSVTKDNTNSPFLTYNPGDIEKQKIEVFLLYCTQEFLPPGQVCATPQEIRDDVVKVSTKVFTKITTKQFNPSKKAYDKKVKLEQFYFSDSLVFLGKFSLQKTTTVINQGFIIQNEKEDTYISGYSKSDQYNTNSFLKQELGMNVLGGCYFFISENGQIQNIQYPQFTSLLAQFSSVFNTLLTVGVICKILAQSQIIQDFIEIQLKLYYKRSAVDLIQNVERKVQNKPESNYSPSSDLFSLYKQIQNMDYKYYIQKYVNVSFLKKIKLFFLSDGSSEANKNDSQQIKIYKKLMSSTSESMNIYDIHQDILKIKMMIRMIFSVEQYAAMKLCGLKINLEEEKVNPAKEQVYSNQEVNRRQQTNYQENGEDEPINSKIKMSNNNVKQSPLVQGQDLKEIEMQIIEKETPNHLEKIDQIEKDNDYFESCLKGFLNKSDFQTQLDQRILDCMIRCQQINQQIFTKEQQLILDKNK